MGQRATQTALQTASVVEVVGGDDTRLGRSISIVKACMGQQLTEAQHIGMSQRGSTRLDEVELIGISRQAVGSEL